MCPYLLRLKHDTGRRLPTEVTLQSVRLLAYDLGMEIASGYSETANEANQFVCTGTRACYAPHRSRRPYTSCICIF